MLGALVLIGMAIWMGYIGFIAPVPHLEPTDVVTREARLLSIQPHRGWLEVHLDMPYGKRPVELPKRLFGSLFHVSWPCREELCGKNGWAAVLGFERSVLNGPASDLAGQPMRLQIVTLEVNGVVHGDLSQHNASMRNAASAARLTVLPLIMLAGLIATMGHGKWRTARSSLHYAASGA